GGGGGGGCGGGGGGGGGVGGGGGGGAGWGGGPRRANARIGSASGTAPTTHVALRSAVARWPSRASRRRIHQPAIASAAATAAITAHSSRPIHSGCRGLICQPRSGSGT